MGELVRVTCEACGIDRDDALGCGMLGTCFILCSCTHCKRLVTKRSPASMTVSPNEPRPLRCPYCKRVLLTLYPREQLTLDDAAVVGACPLCSGPLVAQARGLWD